MRIDHAYYLIVDLEATCAEDGTIPPQEMEIIEIGAVLQSACTFEIVSEFQTFVRPVRHPELTPFCTQLTGITPADLAQAPPFPEALEAMNKWLSPFSNWLFCSWGDYDRKQFLQDCAFHGVPYPFASGHRNLKAELARVLGLPKRLSLGEALRHLGMEFAGSPHRGLDDARNIARIVRRVCQGV